MGEDQAAVDLRPVPITGHVNSATGPFPIFWNSILQNILYVFDIEMYFVLKMEFDGFGID